MNILRLLPAAVAMLAVASTAPATLIIGGTTGDGDFEVAGGAGPAADPQQYTAHPNWFNAEGSEGTNFSNTSQMGGSSQVNSRGGMPFQNRTQVNNTAYTIGAAGEVFSLSYEFGAGGGPAGWNGGGDETMRTFLFTASAPVDGDLTVADMAELGGDDYDINRANPTNPNGDDQWTLRDVPVLYTSTAADVGMTVYFGMQFLNDSGPDRFPRIDLVNLEVTAIPEPASLLTLGGLAVGLAARGRRRR